MPKRVTLETFLERARIFHGQRYDYSKIIWHGTRAVVDIVCHTHGNFKQTPHKHAAGQGCPKCRGTRISQSKTWTQGIFLAKAAKAHPDYDYSKAVYQGALVPVEILCPVHKSFWQAPYTNLNGHGCPSCGNQRNADRHRLQVPELIERFYRVHGSTYDYSRVEHTRSLEPVAIICKKHGLFTQHSYSHLAGQGCPRCGKEALASQFRHTVGSFTAKAHLIHGSVYAYDLSGYSNNESIVTIVCKQHGIFKQKAAHHLAGYGCPVCNASASKDENELFRWVNAFCPDAVPRDRKCLGVEVDILVPSKKLAVEFNGMYWHSVEPGIFDEKGYAKYLACRKAGYSLFVVWEEDWQQKKEVVKHWLQHKLGKAPHICGAREASVGRINGAEANAFYAQYHLQGACSGGQHWGLHYEGQLVAALTFSKSVERRVRCVDNSYYFARLAFAGSVPGGASKLFRHASREIGAKEVYAHSNNSYADGAVKAVIGFNAIGEVPPRYRIWHPHYGIRHRIFWQKNRVARRLHELKIEAKYDTKSITTVQAHLLCGCHYIWDFGKTRWLWTA